MNSVFNEKKYFEIYKIVISNFIANHMKYLKENEEMSIEDSYCLSLNAVHTTNEFMHALLEGETDLMKNEMEHKRRIMESTLKKVYNQE